MSSFFGTLLNAIIAIIRVPLTHIIAFFVGKQAGKKDAELERHKESLDAIAAAEDARRNVKHDDSSVRDDPFNRDNTSG